MLRRILSYRLLIVITSLGLLLMFCLKPVAADKPTIVFLPVDETLTIPADENPCGFDIEAQFTGRVKLTSNSSNPNQSLFAEGDHVHGTFTNPDNGNSVSFITADRITAVQRDNTTILTFNGLQGRVTLPGQGLIVADVGRLVLEFPCLDFNCDPDVLFVAGQMDGGPYPEVCDILSD